MSNVRTYSAIDHRFDTVPTALTSLEWRAISRELPFNDPGGLAALRDFITENGVSIADAPEFLASLL